MEYNNDIRTPRDRLNGDFLRELLNEEFPGFEHMETTNRDCIDRDVRCDERRNMNCRQVRVMPVAEIRPETRPECDCKEHTNVHCHNECANPTTCGCGACEDFSPPVLKGVPLAMVYSPYQEWENLYEPEVGLTRGTVFKCLDLPFYPTRCDGKERCDHRNYR